MSVVKRAASYSASTEQILWRDTGPDAWVFTRTGTGVVVVTFPESFINTDPAVLLSAVSTATVSPPIPAPYLYARNITATGCTVYIQSPSSTAAFDGAFTIEVVGDIA